MEKVLRLYKIPDVGDIVTVIGVGDTQPIAGFSEGDLFIDTSDDGLYEAQDDGQGGLEWVQVSFDTTATALPTCPSSIPIRLSTG